MAHGRTTPGTPAPAIMLPPVETLKAQARLLISHFDKTGRPLSYSAALEAIAAVHRQPDWNTAVALARNHAEAASSAGMERPLTWSAGKVQESVSEVDWFRHTFAKAYDPVDISELLHAHYKHQRARKHGGCFINIANGGLNTELANELLRAGPALHVTQCQTSCELNLFHGLTSAQAEGLAVSMLEVSIGSNGWAFSCLGGWVRAILAEGLPLTLSRLVSTAALEPEALRKEFKNAGADAAEKVETLAESSYGRGVLFAVRAWSTRVQADPKMQLLFSESRRARGLCQLLAAGECVSIEVDEPDHATYGFFIAQALQAGVEARRGRNLADDWVIGCQGLNATLNDPFDSMLAIARGSRVAMILGGHMFDLNHLRLRLQSQAHNKLELH